MPIRLSDNTKLSISGGPTSITTISGTANAFGVDVGNFGAVGNGTTNDTAAVAAGIAAAAAAKMPLLFTGGKTYIVDSLTLISNAVLIGDKNTTIKLKANATGGIFKWAVGTTDNVTVRDLILDGNRTNQPGDPINTTSSGFYGLAGAVVTNSRFTGLEIRNFASAGFGWQNPFSLLYQDTIFDDIKVTNVAQGGIWGNFNRCSMSRCYVDNSANGLSRNNDYCFGLNAISSTFRTLRGIQNNTNLGSASRVGLALGRVTALGNACNNNVIDDVEIDNALGARNFGFTIDTGDHNQVSNIRSKNCIWNADIEILSQTDFQGSNFMVENSQSTANCFGMFIHDSQRVKISGFDYDGRIDTSGSQDIVQIDVGLDPSVPQEILISDFNFTGGYSGFRLGKCTDVQLVNGTRKSGNNLFYVSPGGSGNPVTNLKIDNVNVLNSVRPWVADHIIGADISNVTCTTLSQPGFEHGAGCSNVMLHGINGVAFETFGNTQCFNGFYEGHICSNWRFAQHGGAIGVIDLGDTLPKGAVVTRMNGFIGASTAGAGSISIGIIGDTNAFLAASSGFVLGNPFGGIQDGTVPNYYWNFGPAANIAVEITGGTLTAGFLIWNIWYHIRPS